MVKDPFETVADKIDDLADEKEEIEAKREKRETAKYFYCEICRVFNSQKELRDFLAGVEELPVEMAIIKGHTVNPVKKVIYSI
jgi:hypothetical protein